MIDLLVGILAVAACIFIPAFFFNVIGLGLLFYWFVLGCVVVVWAIFMIGMLQAFYHYFNNLEQRK